MKILVIGGTGLVGRSVCNKLELAGKEVIVGTPSRGVNIITGENLANALDGTEVVIDLSNSPSPEARIALDFFRKAADTLVGAEKSANVKHHLVLSIVGTDRAQHIGYLKAKKYQEDTVIGSGIPYTIIRSTQFHEHIDTIITVQSDGDSIHVSTVDYQPIALEDVVDYIVKLALEQPKNGIVEIAGPDRGSMSDFVESYVKKIGGSKTVVPNQDDQYMFEDIPGDLLVPSGDFFAGTMKFSNWMKNS